MTAVPDFAHTRGAEHNRVLKARKIARWLWDRNLSYSDVLSAGEKRLRAWARAAQVTPPSTMDTWQAVNDALMAMEGFKEDHPDHPSVARNHTDERGKWLGDLAEPAPAPEPVAEVATVTQMRPVDPPDAPVDPLVAETGPAPAPVGPETGSVWPAGWDVLVALGPIGRMDARCGVCKAPAVTATTDWRCANHPPQPGEWGAALNWTPTLDLDAHAPWCPPGRRCYEPRCPNYKLTTAFIKADSALHDERSAANGKNRSPVHVRQAARAAEEARKARR